MTTIESVQIRSQGAYDFATHYESLCALQNSVPVASVKAHLGVGVIDVNADKIRLSDWLPLLKTLKINKTLKCISFRSSFEMPWYKLESGLDPKKVFPMASRKVPSVHSKDVTFQLCKALRECLEVTEALEYIELQGLTLRARDVAELIKGVGKNFTLKHLSFEGSRLDEKSVHVLCEGVKNASSLTYLNLASCGLSSLAVEGIAGVVKHQAMMRHSEAWKNSLRYRVPDLNCMPGLRRITLNRNPLLGDEAAAIFADTLKDDLWLKAVDLQHCGITASGAQQLLDALRFNTTVVVLDVRNNSLIGRELTQKITEQVLLNAGVTGGQHAEYKWLRTTDVNAVNCGSNAQARASASALKGTAATPNTASTKHARRRRPSKSLNPTNVPQHRGLPWRTAQRALLHKGVGLAPLSARSADQWEDVASCDDSSSGDERDHRFPQQLHSSGGSTARSAASSARGPAVVRPDFQGDGVGSGSSAIEQLAASSACPSEPLTIDHLTDSAAGAASVMQLASSGRAAAAEIKSLRVEVEQLRRQLSDEAAARRTAEERLLELSRDNRRLRQQQQQQRDAYQPVLFGNSTVRKRSIEVDEDFLDSVERSFAQYNAFLDVLRDAGLGELVDVAGVGGPPPDPHRNRFTSVPHVVGTPADTSLSTSRTGGFAPKETAASSEDVPPPSLASSRRSAYGDKEVGDAEKDEERRRRRRSRTSRRPAAEVEGGRRLRGEHTAAGQPSDLGAAAASDQRTKSHRHRREHPIANGSDVADASARTSFASEAAGTDALPPATQLVGSSHSQSGCSDADPRDDESCSNRQAANGSLPSAAAEQREAFNTRGSAGESSDGDLASSVAEDSDVRSTNA